MQKLTIFALKRDQDILLKKLHRMGVVQIEDLKGSELSEEITAATPPERLKTVSDHLISVSRMVHLMKLVEGKLPMAQSMFGLDILGKEKVKEKDSVDLLKESQAFVDANNATFVELETRHNEILEEREELKKVQSTARVFSDIGVPPYLLKNTEHINVIAGRVANTQTHALKKELDKELKSEYVINVFSENKKDDIILIITHQEYAGKALFISKKFSVEAFSVEELPEEDELLSWVSNRQDELDVKEAELRKELSAHHKEMFTKSVVIREELEVLKSRYERIYSFLDSDKFFVMAGWAPTGQLLNINRELTEAVDGDVVVRFAPPTQEDNPPVKLTNPGWLRPFEMITELFALPKYKDLDPTFIVGPIFLIYAGFMLTDFFYGLGLAILGAFMLKKFAKHNQGIKDMSIIIFFIGFFSMVFGVLTGSYLGDAPKYIIGKTAADLAFWKDPLAEPLYFLIIALSVAVIHLNFGLVLGTIESVRKRDWKDLISEKIVWWVLQLGVASLALNLFPLAGKILLGIAVLIVIVFKGPIGILGITGFMGDVISYSRLFALALSTAGIALTVNLLASMVGGVPFVGIVLALIIAIVGHVFSYLMNSLGAFVHSIRLQFVEFFGKFYEGGGDKYQPFAEERYYTIVSHDNEEEGEE
ncbi:MAG: V-type ATP synthase subunit I [archaeon]